jgi:hypothetical protein
MNLVERGFGAVKKVQRSVHRKVKALAKDISAWTATWDKDPKPFAWHKSWASFSSVWPILRWSTK